MKLLFRDALFSKQFGGTLIIDKYPITEAVKKTMQQTLPKTDLSQHAMRPEKHLLPWMEQGPEQEHPRTQAPCFPYEDISIVRSLYQGRHPYLIIKAMSQLLVVDFHHFMGQLGIVQFLDVIPFVPETEIAAQFLIHQPINGDTIMGTDIVLL